MALMTGREIVCLCGSTRFKKQYEEQMRQLTLAGFIVLTVGLFGHHEDTPLTDEIKRDLDLLHLDKIKLAHVVSFICPGGYIGESTKRELEYARKLGKRIAFPYDSPKEDT